MVGHLFVLVNSFFYLDFHADMACIYSFGLAFSVEPLLVNSFFFYLDFHAYIVLHLFPSKHLQITIILFSTCYTLL